MPNWCSNTAIISHDDIEVLRNLHEVMDTGGWFSFFHPVENLSDAIEKWGTKWEADIAEAELVDGNIHVIFSTAWSPPVTIYETMKDCGYYITAEYFEPGMCFIGSYDNGIKEYYDYSDCETGTEIRECIGETLDDNWSVSETFDEFAEMAE